MQRELPLVKRIRRAAAQLIADLRAALDFEPIRAPVLRPIPVIAQRRRVDWR